MEFRDVLANRHSIRDFDPRPVATDVLERVFSGVALAPSAMNEQPWQFYACTGNARTRLGEIVAQATVHLAEYMDVLGPKRYEDAMHWYSSLGDAPVIVAVTMLSTGDEVMTMNRYLSIGAAIENLLLGATAEGLGCCNITFAHWVQSEMNDFLGLPEGREVVALVTMGYPGPTPAASPEHRTDIVTWLD